MAKTGITAGMLAVSLMLGGCSGTVSADFTSEGLADDTDYSIGLDAEGYYTDFENVDYTFGTTTDINDAVAYAIHSYATASGKAYTADSFVREYCCSMLHSMGAGITDYAATGNYVEVSLDFGEGMEDLDNTRTLIAGDSGAVSETVIGKSAGDTYTVDYTFPDDDEEYGGQTVALSVTVNSTYTLDILNDATVAAHSSDISSTTGTAATTVDGMMKAVAGNIAESYLTAYIQDSFENGTTGIEAPEQYAEYEWQRFMLRLTNLGMTVEDYMISQEATRAELGQVCRNVAAGNMLYMTYARENGITVTKDDVKERYTDYDGTVELMGENYMMLATLRDAVVNDMANRTIFTGEIDYNAVQTEMDRLAGSSGK